MKQFFTKLFVISIFLFLFHSFAFAQLSRVYENGAALFTKKDYKGSLIMMNRVIQKSEFYYEAYTIRARCHEQLGNPDSALIDFNRALEIKEGFLPAIFFRGVLHFNQKRYEQAISDFNTVLNQRGNYINALIYRGRSHEALNHRNQAIEDYTKAINLRLKNAEVYYRRGLLYEKQLKPKDAIWDYTKAIELKKDYLEALHHRGHMYLLRNMDEEALRDFDHVLSLTDTIPDVFQLRGDLRFKQGDYIKATKDYTLYMQKKRDRGDWKIYLKRAEAYYLDSNHRKAFRDYTRVHQLKRDYDVVALGMAKCRLMEGKPSLAKPLLDRTIMYNAANYEAWYLKGRLLYDTKDYKGAKACFDESIKYGQIPGAYFFRGSCQFEMGASFEACEDLKKSVELGYKEEGIEKMLKRVCR